ncbi:MAG: glutaredoxin domain-containing protein [Candidatus Micrarchaeia archaeon]|jgi:glutaredoxin
MKNYFILLILLLISISFAEVLEINYFYGETCPHCAKVKPTLDNLEIKYEGKIVINKYEIYNNKDNGILFKEFLSNYGKSSSGVPALFVSDKFLIGSKQIPEELEGIILENIDETQEVEVSPITNSIDDSNTNDFDIMEILKNPFVLLIIIIILIVIAYEINIITNKKKR